MRIIDELSGFTERAVARWRLAPGDWRLEGNVLASVHGRLELSCTSPLARVQLVDGWASRHYLERTPLPVLEIELRQPGALPSALRWWTAQR